MAMQLSGSLVISGSIIASAGITGSFSGSATSASYADTLGGLPSSSFAPAATFNTVSQSFATTSGSIAGRVTLIEGQDATTGSNTFTGVQYVSQASNAISFTSTASLYTDGGLRVAKDSFVSGTAYFNNITVYGTSSIEYITSSQVNIGSNVITVNTDTPAIRFGGISVFDSGSTQLTGSLFWDSEKNHWIYSNPSGSEYNSAMLMNGPRNTGSLGTEQGTTNNALMKGQGGDHITSSQVIDDGTTVQIPGNLQVTGSLINTGAATFSSSVTATDLIISDTYANDPLIKLVTTTSGNVEVQMRTATTTYNPGIGVVTSGYDFSLFTNNTPRLTIASTGAATFSSSITATSGLFSSTGVGVFNSQLTLNNTTSASALITFQNTANGYSFGFSSVGTGGQRFSFFNGAPTEIAYITGAGAATFSSSVTATSLTLSNSSAGTLAIAGNTVGNGIVSITKNSTYNSEGSAAITINSTNSLSNTELLIGTDGTNNIAYLQTAAQGTSYSSKNLSLQPNGGNVAIGTTTDYGYKFVTNGEISSVTPSGTKAIVSIFQVGWNKWNFQMPANSVNLQIDENGTPRVTVASGGNVGIGTATDYSSKLTIIPSSNPTSSTGANNQISIGEVSNNTGYCLKLGYIYTGGGYQGSIQSIAGSAGSTLFLNASGGNVIIGSTTDSNQKLTVNGSYVRMHSLSTDNTNAGVFYEVKNGASTVGQSSQLVDNAGNYIITTGTSSEAERFRITAAGYLKASNDGTYYSSTGAYHEFRQSVADNTLIFHNTAASSPYGIFINYTAIPNNTSSYFIRCFDGNASTLRAEIRSNGGIANYQANDVNLSDIRTKKDIAPLESYWDKFKAIEIVKFKYKDQTHDDYNIGVIAQQVEEVAPEFVDTDGWGKEDSESENPLWSVYTADLHHATIKVLQEAMAKIETLEARVKELENK